MARTYAKRVTGGTKDACVSDCNSYVDYEWEIHLAFEESHQDFLPEKRNAIPS